MKREANSPFAHLQILPSSPYSRDPYKPINKLSSILIRTITFLLLFNFALSSLQFHVRSLSLHQDFHISLFINPCIYWNKYGQHLVHCYCFNKFSLVCGCNGLLFSPNSTICFRSCFCHNLPSYPAHAQATITSSGTSLPSCRVSHNRRVSYRCCFKSIGQYLPQIIAVPGKKCNRALPSFIF